MPKPDHFTKQPYMYLFYLMCMFSNFEGILQPIFEAFFLKSLVEIDQNAITPSTTTCD